MDHDVSPSSKLELERVSELLRKVLALGVLTVRSDLIF